MLFNSMQFLIFFPIVLIVYFFISKKIRYIWLFVISYYFYMSWNPKFIFLILFSTIITYLSGILIDKYPKYKKFVLITCLLLNISLLVVFKYANFILENINGLNNLLGIGKTFHFDIILPVGISFYTFQALGYLIDVYRKNIAPEKNFCKYALFVSFFPQLVAGPIERSKNLLNQLKNVDKINLWNYSRIKEGFLLMLWGFFQKLVIADRISIVVNNVVGNYTKFGFVEILTAVILFAFQIYCDFGGYSNIAKGTAKIMGIELMDNFKEPYFATSIKDFWRRWHISLTTWFTDYIYIPLGGNRKGLKRKYLNFLIVFFISGLWHGASWNFVIWGLIHGIYQIIEDILRRMIKIPKNGLIKILKIFVTFVLVDFAWIFFLSNSFRHALSLISQMMLRFKTTGIFSLGLNVQEIILLLCSLVLLFIVDLLHERGINIYNKINRKGLYIILRIIIYLGLIWLVLMLGIYGPEYNASEFIYFQF